MNQKSSYMEELANALFKNAPFEAEEEIGYVTKGKDQRHQRGHRH
jgi:hypothetical protein